MDGDQGLEVLAPGSPSSVEVACDPDAAVLSEVDEVSSPGESGLSYDASTGLYVLPWQTASQWSGTCRELRLTLSDGTTHRALFEFR